MYESNGQDVSLFILEGETRAPAELDTMGHHTRIWSRGGNTFVLVSPAADHAVERAVQYVEQEAHERVSLGLETVEVRWTTTPARRALPADHLVGGRRHEHERISAARPDARVMAHRVQLGGRARLAFEDEQRDVCPLDSYIRCGTFPSA